jgi:adenosylcobyric acid synthase
LKNVAGTLNLPGQPAAKGYEIHMGVTAGPALATPAASLNGAGDGAISADGAILATYCHGLFDASEALAALLQWAGADIADTHFDAATRREADIDRLADAVDQAFRWEKLAGLLP